MLNEEERRRGQRYPIWFPVKLAQGVERESFAVSYDASESGLRISTTSELDLGTEVMLTFRVPVEHAVSEKVAGRIVRTERNTEDPYGLWPYRIAVEFTEPMTGLETLLEWARLIHSATPN